MNKTKRILLGAALSLALTLTLAAGTPDPWPAYATGGTDVGNTLCYAVISAHSANAGAPVVTYLNATSDLSSSKVQFYTCGATVPVTGANTTTTIPATTNNASGWVANGIIVIQHIATDTYERRIISSVTSSNVVVTVAPTAATAAGDKMWLATTAGSIPCGATTLIITGDCYAGQPQKPLLLEVDGTSSCQINAVAAKYVK